MLGSQIGGESDLSASYLEFTGGINGKKSRSRSIAPCTKEARLEAALREWSREPKERQWGPEEIAGDRPEKPGAREEPLVTP